MSAIIERSQSQMLEQIKQIEGNSSLNRREKEIRRQALFTPFATCSPCTINNSTSTTAMMGSDDLSLHCTHYEKNCSRFFFECCGVFDPCHRCHQARGCKVKPPRISSIQCSSCGKDQPPSDRCINPACQLSQLGFARSHCGTCKIWTAAEIHHCDACGFCRVGKKEHLHHCHNCEACFIRKDNEPHMCSKIPLSEAVCPCCLDPIHTAQLSSTVLPNCGHVLHIACMKESLKNKEYRCPTCRKSMIDMESSWQKRKMLIASNPIPKNFFVYRPGEIVSCPTGRFRIISIEQTNVPQVITVSEGTNEGEEDDDEFIMEIDECQDFDEIKDEGDQTSGNNSDSTSVATSSLSTSSNVQVSALTNIYYGEELDVPVSITAFESVYNKRTYSGFDLTLLPIQIGCHDCGKKSQTAFHYYGLECQCCSSFNTFQL